MKKFAILISLLLSFSPSLTYAFDDISDSPYQKGILELKSAGIVVGDAGTANYRPNSEINRAEMAKIVVFALKPGDLSAHNSNCFKDVPKNQWYTQPICYAKSQGWITGYPDGTFRPSANITNFEAMSLAATTQQIAFTRGEPWYKNLVETLAADNLIPYTIFSAHKPINRAEMADLLSRIRHHKSGDLRQYLDHLAALQATYDTILAGEDLSEYRTVELKQ